MKKIILLTALVASFNAFANSVYKPQVVMPETLTTVDVSNKDFNYFTCTNGQAVDFVKSKEKAFTVSYTNNGKGFLVKFSLKKNTLTQETLYNSEPVELILTCGEQNYELLLRPTMSDMKKIILGGPNANPIKENIALFRGKDLEDAAHLLALQVILESAENPLPYSYAVTPAPKDIAMDFYMIDGIALRPIKNVKVEGIGIRATEYQIFALRDIKLQEDMFLKTPLGDNIFTVTLADLNLTKGQQTTLVINHLENY